MRSEEGEELLFLVKCGQKVHYFKKNLFFKKQKYQYNHSLKFGFFIVVDVVCFVLLFLIFFFCFFCFSHSSGSSSSKFFTFVFVFCFFSPFPLSLFLPLATFPLQTEKRTFKSTFFNAFHLFLIFLQLFFF